MKPNIAIRDRLLEVRNQTHHRGHMMPATLVGARQWAWRTVRGKRPLVVALNIVLAASLLMFWARSVPLSQLAAHTLPHHPSRLLVLLVLTVLAMLARAARWKLLLRPLASVSLRDAFWINAAAALANYVVPLRAGEGVRLWWLSRRQAVAAGSGLGVILVDHLFDLGGVTATLGLVSTLTVAGATTGLARPADVVGLLGGAVLLFGLIGSTAFFGPRLARSRLGRSLGPSRHGKLLAHADSFRSGLAVICSPRRLAALLAATMLAVTFDGLSFSMLFSTLGIQVPVVSAAAAQAALLYVYLLPAAPGYVGSLEVTGTTFLNGELGLPPAIAAGAVMLWHGISATTIFAFGLVALRQVVLPSRGRSRPAVGQ